MGLLHFELVHAGTIHMPELNDNHSNMLSYYLENI